MKRIKAAILRAGVGIEPSSAIYLILSMRADGASFDYENMRSRLPEQGKAFNPILVEFNSRPGHHKPDT